MHFFLFFFLKTAISHFFLFELGGVLEVFFLKHGFSSVMLVDTKLAESE